MGIETYWVAFLGIMSCLVRRLFFLFFGRLEKALLNLRKLTAGACVTFSFKLGSCRDVAAGAMLHETRVVLVTIRTRFTQVFTQSSILCQLVTNVDGDLNAVWQLTHGPSICSPGETQVCILSYYIKSYRIIPYHTMSYHIIPYHIRPYHVVSFHVI